MSIFVAQRRQRNAAIVLIAASLLGGLVMLSSIVGAAIGGAAGIIGGREQRSEQSRWMDREATFNQASAREAMLHDTNEADRQRQWSGGQADLARRFNAGEARLNRAFQREMANSAYQRAMTDMSKAGLNPILAYKQGGAHSPSGAMATSPLPSGAKGQGHSARMSAQTPQDIISRAVNSGFKAATQTQQMRHAEEMIKQAKVDTAQKQKYGNAEWAKQLEGLVRFYQTHKKDLEGLFEWSAKAADRKADNLGVEDSNRSGPSIRRLPKDEYRAKTRDTMDAIYDYLGVPDAARRYLP